MNVAYFGQLYLRPGPLDQSPQPFDTNDSLIMVYCQHDDDEDCLVVSRLSSLQRATGNEAFREVI